jgi:hypothetical protein
MAVKVMLAPSLVKRDEERALKDVNAKRGEAKPKRRRSSVYDADGNEVFITLMCLKCRKVRPLSQFGLRKMSDGAIRNQPWCRTCRSGAGADAPKRGRRGEEPGLEVPVDGVPLDTPEREPQLDAGALAAQVVAALSRGRG